MNKMHFTRKGFQPNLINNMKKKLEMQYLKIKEKTRFK